MTAEQKKKAHELEVAGWRISPGGVCISPMLCVVQGVDRAYQIFWGMKDGKKGVNRG